MFCNLTSKRSNEIHAIKIFSHPKCMCLALLVNFLSPAQFPKIDVFNCFVLDAKCWSHWNTVCHVRLAFRMQNIHYNSLAFGFLKIGCRQTFSTFSCTTSTNISSNGSVSVNLWFTLHTDHSGQMDYGNQEFHFELINWLNTSNWIDKLIIFASDFKPCIHSFS